ncbi:uncharacterized protein BT62DRAFT_524146 [Guyanagaster necrorhizus]|uniref:Uncharacterized protein n=1 Tax=Guyanagaster necrorhizus TaxID=856835 RepID=A0A9P8AWQ8_9AGAR|nr:uncharacterized protein BT62DRAFT_524146 [Guyanagaster necrorhizus MCA 3950]KAG7450590.1 hypothetical protein BT62DRAFT_524146 [Guyanagaster necrorhizus MCA 3950]
MHCHLSLVIILSILSWSFLSAAFSFSAGTPTQCDDISITWNGGTAPYLLLLTPVFGTPRNISIPDSAYSSGKGTYETQIPFSSGQKFVMVMSDASGFGAGGATELLTVGSSLGGSCNTTDPGVDFSFELNSALQQCRTYTFSAYTSAVQPVTIMGIIPDGDTFVINPPEGPTEYDWTADVYNGTSIIFAMADSEGRQGGSSDVKTVGISTDQSCIDDSSPSSTATPSSTSLPSTSSTTSATTSTTTSSSGTSIGAIAGTVLGGLVFLAAVITLALFFLRRKRDRDNRWDNGTDLERHSRRLQSDIDLADGYDARGHANTPSGSAFPFFVRGTDYAPTTPDSEAADHYNRGMPDSQPNPFASPQDHDHSPTSIDPFTAHHHSQPSGSQTMSSAQRKAATAGAASYTPSRFILHTDADDVPLPPPNEDGVVELPPQYSERTAPQSIPSRSSLSRTVDDAPLYSASSQLSSSQSHHSPS